MPTSDSNSPKANIDFIVEFGVALHRYGTSAHRLEGAVRAMGAILALQTDVFSTPTTIMFGFGPISEQHTILVRVEPGAHNLEKLSQVDELADKVSAKEISIPKAIDELNTIRDTANSIGEFWTTMAFPVVCASCAVFMGGGPGDLLVGGGSGLLIGLLLLFIPRTVAGGRLFEFISAALAGGIAHVASHLFPSVSYQTSMLAGVIVLVPGLTLTVAMSELATRNLVSGTARFTSAIIVFLEMLFGIALSETLLSHWIGPPQMAASVGLPEWANLVALAAASLSVPAIFRAQLRDYLIIAFTAVCAFYSARYGAQYLTPELGAGAGGFVAAAIANSYARIKNRSAVVPLVPGLLLLVPGSLGFRGLNSIWSQDTLGGIDTTFRMILVAISLVIGILVANAVILPRRHL